MNNQSDNDIILPIKIICEIVADSKIVNDIVIPFDFQILKENMPISFDVYYENKKIEKKYIMKKLHLYHILAIVKLDLYQP